VRTYKILSDGRRQIGGFYLPGDVFGLEFRDEHTFSAEAITETRVVVVKRSMLMTLAGRDPGISRELLTLSGSELRHVQTRMLLLVKPKNVSRVFSWKWLNAPAAAMSSSFP
jgi:CRP/FNR family nitrogen fixation transcriptional regulator